ncbi:MAG: hypothetical protein J3R72DRAFT_234235 [Linnemannia gamsii]|nr:MAG: hypothetical protein J3R72DRAFT_234235 [Linnemannia gamsii]
MIWDLPLRSMVRVVFMNSSRPMMKALDSVLDHGGLDAMIYLCSMVHGYELHSLATSALAALAEHQSIQSVIVSKRAMPKLFYLVAAYAQHIVTSPLRPPSPPMSLTRMASTASLHTKSVRRIETVAVVLMNITHIVFQMVPDKLLAKQMVMEGAMDGLMLLCVYFPAGVRTRAMENAIRSIAVGSRPDDIGVGITGVDVVEDNQFGSSGRMLDEDEQHQRQEEAIQVSMDDRFHTRLESMQGLAAKCISVMASDASNQAFIVDDPERIDRLVQLLYSNNPDVVKYASKTMAYLSLRNDRFKPDIVKGSGATALLTVIRSATLGGASGGSGVFVGLCQGEGNINTNATAALSEAVSHACCALANLATNTESQEILMSQMDLLHTTCAVVGLFPQQREIERHVARLIANLALYEQNKLSLLTEYSSPSDNNGSIEQQHPPSPRAHPHRYSSPPPPPRRAKGNVIPTLLRIGALTLERSRHVDDQELDSFAYQQGHHHQDAIDFMNDDGQQQSAKSQLHRGDAGFLMPNDSVSDVYSGYQEHDDDGTSSSSGAVESNAEGEVLKWETIAGTEDVQRHIIRAIDNLMTSVMDDPSSNQSFKVFSRIKPTIGLIKTIQLVNQDEDTQRRATHVLSTLIEQQHIHAETIAALDGGASDSSEKQRQQHVEEETRAAAEARAAEIVDQQRLVEEERLGRERAELERVESERVDRERLEQEHFEQQRLAKERLEQEHAVAAAEAAKKERTEQERIEKKRVEQERLEKELLDKERLEQQRLEKERAATAVVAEKERLEQEKAEKKRVKQERVEKERLEKERVEGERLEQQRVEKERAEQEKADQKRAKKERREAERAEKERLETERAEKERLDSERAEKERLETKRAEKERLEEEKRIEAERLEAELVEQERVQAERIEQERLEEERLEQERIEAERIEQERREQERIKAERLEKERFEAERVEAERIEQERLEQERIKAVEEEKKEAEKQRIEEEKERLASERAEKERIVRERVEQARHLKKRLEQEQEQVASKAKAETSTAVAELEPEPEVEESSEPLSKSSSTSEDLVAQDEGPKASEKAKKKKKKRSSK